MHWKRWITALILVPPLVWLILKAGAGIFAVTMGLAGTLCLWEYYRVTFQGHTPAVSSGFQFWGYGCGALVIAAAHNGNAMALMLALALNLTGAAVMSIFRFRNNADAPLVAVKQVFGVLYISVFISFLVLLRNTADGPLWVLFLFWVIAWGDTGALYVGTLWGRHKLCPSVSPKKTVEGAAGGLAANLVFAWLFKLLFFHSMAGVTCTLFALIVGVLGQLGDLFESEFKRAAGVKDSSNLLPGHGGFLDRLDALLLAAPAAFFLKEFVLP
ncbi:MAG: phosphatidate cytidylyltransferase [Desulfobacteraceae bacterium]|jgi:phosphatidate cytidylyltransferase